MIIVYAVLAAVMLVGGFLYLNRPYLVTVNALVSPDFPATGFAHEQFETLLHKYVDSSGNVDYDRWHRNAADKLQLDQYLAAVSRYSPENAPERFAKRSEALAYWLYSYNAYVIWSVLGNWPLESVTDVKAPIEVITGLGFFYRQRFLFGEVPLSLYAVEHKKILHTYKDPRIHFVLNCASDSCPVLRPELPTGDELEAMLISSTADFVNDPRNVRVDHDNSQIILSTIFKWYQNDFLNDLRRRGLSTERGVVDFVADAGSAELQTELDGAGTYEVVFADYNWALNSLERPSH